VSEFAPGSTTPTTELAGLSAPKALAFDSHGNLYVANSDFGQGTTVNEFAPGSTVAAATLTGVTDPVALAFDPNGNLFVANYVISTVSEFKPGSTTPTATLTGLNQPMALAVDSSGDLFVANFDGDSVTEIDASTGALVRVIDAHAYGFDGPDGFTLSGNDLFVMNTWGSLTTSR